MKKVLPLLVLASTCLASCGDVDFYGKYKFTLGREGDDQTRVSIEMNLKEEDSDKLQGFKNFDARFELTGVGGISGLSEDDVDESLVQVAQSIFPFSVDENGVTTIPGFYKVQDLKDDKYGNKIKIAFDLGNDLNKIITDIGLDPTEVVSNFVCAYCNGSSFTFQVPVSITDIQMQLAWYGTYIDINPYIKDRIHSLEDAVSLFLEGKISPKVYQLKEFYDHKLPGEQDPDKRFGSHPDSESVSDMNKKYQGLFSNTFVYKNVGGVAGTKLGSVFCDIEDNQYYFAPLSDEFDPSVGTYDVIMKEDIGVLNYDFSKDTEVTLSIVGNPWEDGSYACGVKYKGTSDNIDWKLFYQDPFVFRCANDIKIELKKE